MKKLLILSALVVSPTVSHAEWVNGYTDRDGYHEGYYRQSTESYRGRRPATEYSESTGRKKYLGYGSSDSDTEYSRSTGRKKYLGYGQP